MKKFFFSTGLCFLSVWALGQFEWVYENGQYHEFGNELFKTLDDKFVLLHDRWNGGISSKVTVLDDSGIVVNELVGGLSTNGIHEIYSVFGSVDSTFTLTTTIANGSGGFYEVFGALLRFDKEWDYELTVMDIGEAEGDVFSDSSYILLNLWNEELTRTTVSGSNIWQFDVAGYNAKSLGINSKDTLFLATNVGLLTFDIYGNLVAEHSAHLFDQLKITEYDAIVGIKDSTICLISPDYFLFSKDIYPGSIIKDFAVDHGKITVLTSLDSVYVYNDSMSLTSKFKLPGIASYYFIEIGKSGLILGGEERYGLFNNVTDESTRSPFLKEFSFYGDGYNISNDIGVTDIELQGEMEIITNPGNYHVIYNDVQITVQNFGEHPVNDLYVRSKNYWSRKYYGLSLQPGASTTLTWDRIYGHYYPSDPAGQMIDLCLWTSHPDARLDIDPSNDTYCMNLLVHDEEVHPGDLFSIFPNPVSDMLHVQWQMPVSKQNPMIRIVDVNGKVLLSEILDPAYSEQVIPVSTWPAGVYLLQYVEEGVLKSVKRFVVSG